MHVGQYQEGNKLASGVGSRGVLASTEPHRLWLGDWEMGTVISWKAALLPCRLQPSFLSLAGHGYCNQWKAGWWLENEAESAVCQVAGWLYP